MGLERACTVEWRGSTVAGKALLETDEILFRGELRLKILRARVTAVSVDGGALRVTFDGETATFALGEAAEKWARALATVKSRLDKLGVAPGKAVSVVGVDDAAFHEELQARVGAFSERVPAKGCDLLVFGVHAPADLDRFPALVRAISPDGGLWVIRPKGHAEVTEAKVRAAAKGAGLVGMKVASFSATHTADKFVIPAAARGARAPAEARPKSPGKRRT